MTDALPAGFFYWIIPLAIWLRYALIRRAGRRAERAQVQFT